MKGSKNLKSLVGKYGISISKLRTIGYVKIDGIVWEALPMYPTSAIQKNTPVKVVGLYMNQLVVEALK